MLEKIKQIYGEEFYRQEARHEYILLKDFDTDDEITKIEIRDTEISIYHSQGERRLRKDFILLEHEISQRKNNIKNAEHALHLLEKLKEKK